MYMLHDPAIKHIVEQIDYGECVYRKPLVCY